MASGRIQLVVKDLPIHHFPSKPTCLAYDNEAKKLAIGCDNGEIIILDGQQRHMPQQPQTINGVKAMDLLLSFGIGKDILLAAHKKSNHLFLWSAPYRSNPTQLVLPVKEIPTVLAWSSAYSTFFVGTTAGTVYQVFVRDNKMEKEDLTASMLGNKCVSAGEVVTIVEEPQTVWLEDKGTHNVLVVFSSGLCVLWNQQQGCSLQEQINDAGTSICVKISVAEQDPSVLAVLTESELVLLNMNTKSQEIKHSCGTIMLQYPRLSQFNGYPHFTPPVTCLQYYGVCSQELLMSALQPQSRHVSDLIVTGHKDGSVRLWLMFYDDKSSSSVASFELTLVVYTAEYYDIPQGQQINLAGLKELSLVKVTSDQQYLLVVNKSCHVLLFKLYPHTTTSAPTTANTKPQSHEVILMEVQDAMPPNKALPTPSPHLHSCQWQTHVQLLQHFICYYQSGRGKKLNPVPVNCVEYDKELVMLAVGTNKGLIILDMFTNMLIQVIGSEKKLLELSGCDDYGGSSVPRDSKSECKVVKLSAAKICSTASQQYVPQLALWAGTAGGSLGVFTVTRNKNGEPFQLQRTRESRQNDSAITSIQLIQTPVIPGAKSIEQQYSSTLESVEEKSVTPTTYTVVTTEKQCYILYAKKTEIADTSIITNILTSGIVTIMGNKPYLICVLKNGTVNIYSLPDMNEMNVEDAKLDIKSTLYSSAGSFAVLQLSQGEKLKLITLQLFEFVISSV